MLKRSKQRQAILDYLASTTEHPTADTIYKVIREKFPNISLGTVYRNLALLSSTGDIIRISSTDGADRYDYTTSPHYHFMCTNCGKVYDLPMDTLYSINDLAQQFTSHKISGHQTFFYGICKECNAKKQKTS